MVITDRGIEEVSSFINETKSGGYETDSYRVFGNEKLRRGTVMFNNGIVPTRIIKTKMTELEGSLGHKL